MTQDSGHGPPVEEGNGGDTDDEAPETSDDATDLDDDWYLEDAEEE
jgi:hypothetical protein